MSDAWPCAARILQSAVITRLITSRTSPGAATRVVWYRDQCRQPDLKNR